MAGKGRPENLVPTTERSVDEAREMGRKGGIASGKARREKKIIQEALLKYMGEDDLEAVARGMWKRAKNSTRAAEVLRDTIDGKPKESIDFNGELGLIDDRREILKNFFDDLTAEWKG